MSVPGPPRIDESDSTWRHGAVLVTRGTSRADLSESVILVDKPQGLTSGGVVRRLRRLSGTRRVGHAGTLDPMATGLLICMTGRCTKLSRHFLEMEKEYTGTIRLGQTTPSYDADTPVDHAVSAGHVTVEDVRGVAARWIGEIIQQTPPYSAVKVAGERLYRRARRGDHRSGPPRVITIHDLQILRMRGSDVDFRLRCSKGTYVRALAHDVGRELGVGGHLVALRRESIGEFSVADAIPFATLDAGAGSTPDPHAEQRNDHAG